MLPLIRILNSILWSNRLKNSLCYSKNNRWTKSLSLILDLRMQKTYQDRIWPDSDSAHTAAEMDTLSCTAEPKLSLIRSKNNRHEVTKSAAQSSLVITINEEYLVLDLRIVKTSVSNPRYGTTRQTSDKLASTQIRTETQTQMDNITKLDQATTGATGQITVTRPKKSSMLDQNILILSTTETFHRATTCLHTTQFNSSTTRDKMQ